MKRILTLVLFMTALAVWLRAPGAAAQAVDEATRAAARQVMEEGLAAYQAAQYEQALEKFERAWAVMRIPTVGLHRARAMAKVGKLVEAAEQYLEVTRLDASGDTALQQEAKAAAPAERLELLKRIPKLEFKLVNARPEDVELTVDGQQVAASLIVVPRQVNPGTHQVRARRATEMVSKDVTVKEGETAPVELAFAAAPEPSAAPPQPVPSTPPPGPVQETPTAPPGGDAQQTKLKRTLGWVGIGVGGVGVLVGAITGVVALTEKSSLDESACSDARCVAGTDVGRYNSMRIVSGAGFIVGAVGLGAGLVLLLTTPKPAATRGARVTPYLGPASLGVQGRF